MTHFPAITSQHTRDIHPLLNQCWSTVYDADQTLIQQWMNVSCLLGYSIWESQQTRDFEPMSFLCWASVVDGGHKLKQHWFKVSCLLECDPVAGE